MTQQTMRSPVRRRAAAGGAGAAALMAAIAASALAIPPGGPGENRGGSAVVTIAAPAVVAPPGSTAPGPGPGDPPVATDVVRFTGSGFPANADVFLKLDDGLVLPTTPAPGAPGADVFAKLTTSPAGAFAGSVDLEEVRAADRGIVGDGAHLLRFLVSSPAARSVHAGFAVRATLPANPGNGAGSGFVSPPPDQLWEFPQAADPDRPYEGVPRLVAGSVVPYRYAGFTAGQTVNIRPNDTGAPLLQAPADAGGEGSGYLRLDTSTPGSNWLRLLGANTGTPPNTVARSLVAPYAIVPNATGRDVKLARHVLAGSSLAFATQALTRDPADYVPIPPSGQTFRAQIEGEAPNPAQTADATGVATGTLAVPPGHAPGAYTALFTIGFAKQNDFPQAVFARPFQVVTELPPATAALAAAGAAPGATVAFTLGSFARNAGGGQRVAVHVDGVAAPVACLDADVAGDATGSFALPGGLAAGPRAIRFVAGSECVAGGPLTQPPAREVERVLTIAPPQDLRPGAPPPVERPAATGIAIRSTTLRVGARWTIALLLRPASTRVRTTIVIRTQRRVRLAGRSRATRVVTIARRAYTSVPGRATRTVRLALTRDGRSLLRRVRSVRVQVRVTPVGGRAVTKVVTLRR